MQKKEICDIIKEGNISVLFTMVLNTKCHLWSSKNVIEHILAPSK